MMPEFVSILHFNPIDPEHIFLKSRLEEAGIQCYITNEFSRIRRGGGRCELQISNSDLNTAIPILKETGFYNPEPIISSPYLKRFSTITKKIPGFGKLSNEWRLLIVTLLVVGSFSTILFFQLQESNEEIVTKHSWCVEKISWKGKEIFPKTIGLVIVSNDGCKEKIRFPNYDVIDLPGINSMETHGKWILYKNEITISEVEENPEIFEGTYELNFSNYNNNLILQSNHTTIYLHSTSW